MEAVSVAFFVDEKSDIDIAAGEQGIDLVELTYNADKVALESIGNTTIEAGKSATVTLEPGVYGFVAGKGVEYTYTPSTTRLWTKGGKDPWPVPPPPPPPVGKKLAGVPWEVWYAFDQDFASGGGASDKKVRVTIKMSGKAVA